MRYHKIDRQQQRRQKLADSKTHTEGLKVERRELKREVDVLRAQINDSIAWMQQGGEA